MKRKVLFFYVFLVIMTAILGNCNKKIKTAKVTEGKLENIEREMNWHELNFVKLQRDWLYKSGGSFIPIRDTKLFIQGNETSKVIEPYSEVFSCFYPNRKMQDYFKFGAEIVKNHICLMEDNKKQWNNFIGKEVALGNAYHCWFEYRETVVGPQEKYALLVRDGCKKPPEADLAKVIPNTYWRGCYKRVCPMSKFDQTIDVCRLDGGIFLPLSKEAAPTVRYTGEKTDDGNGDGVWHFFNVGKIVNPVYCIKRSNVVLGFSSLQKEIERINKIKSNHEWSEDIKRNLALGKIYRGMNREMSEAALGVPSNIQQTVDDNGREQLELYYRGGTDETKLILKGNKLVSWQEKF